MNSFAAQHSPEVEIVSKRMGSNFLTDARDLSGLLAGPPYRVSADVVAGDVAGKEPVAGFVHPPPSTQDLQ